MNNKFSLTFVLCALFAANLANAAFPVFRKPETWSPILANAEARMEQALARRLTESERNDLADSIQRGVAGKKNPKLQLANAGRNEWKKVTMACVHAGGHIMVLSSLALLCYAWDSDEVYGLYGNGWALPMFSGSAGGGLLMLEHAPNVEAEGKYSCINAAAAAKFVGARVTACRDENVLAGAPESRAFVYIAYQGGLGTDAGPIWTAGMRKLF